MTAIALRKRITDIIEEYDDKFANVENAIAAFERAGQEIKNAACVVGTFGETSIDVGRIYAHSIKESLLKSAWRTIYNRLNIEQIASAKDKQLFEQSMANPAPFTLENIKGTFGDYILNPRENILRGLAEVFCNLDPAFKSHDKVKIGVKGLPKRIIISSLNSFYGYGRKELEDTLNALAAYQGKPLVTYEEMEKLLKDEEALLADRGVRLRRFNNGNGHLFFEPDTLLDINRALAEYYGEVLADTSDQDREEKINTKVAKDLQYYPTPQKVVEYVLDRVNIREGEKVLEPSCGCGRFLDALRDMGADARGIEIDASRASKCRQKGHKVMVANFLETIPTGDYDRVVMNPPFYGKHYANHVKHALKFLKEGGTLTAILPVTARYDHKLLDGNWQDLPTGSFKESGTNINTTILTIRK